MNELTDVGWWAGGLVAGSWVASDACGYCSLCH